MNKLRLWRIERGLSQLELAQASGVPRWAIQLSEMSIRSPEPKDQVALCAALGLTTETVFPGNQETTPESGDIISQ